MTKPAVSTGANASEPRRLTPTERLHEVTMSVLNRKPSEPEQTITVARNARGVFQFEVAVRGADVAACQATAEAVVSDLVTLYPYPVTNGGTES